MATEDFYNENADNFYNRTLNVNMDHFYQEFLPYIPKSGSILDAGCGSGRDAKFFQEQGYAVTATDSAIEMVKRSGLLLGKPSLHLSFENIDMNEEFDGIWANASLLHVKSDKLPEILKKLCKALKPGGVLFMSFKYGEGEYIKDGRHFSDHTEITIRKVIALIPEFEELKSWKSADTRNSSAEFWLSSLVRKRAG
ncbi:MAG: class I SAM-dependent methyltransferase [Alphaproteobacteria bacterium]|nr:class I SAM-dependent methyltransferase [Alphaproteobacteria bacterium]